MKLGIAGLPNVGKTSLFNILTAANSQVASYPFTTIERNIGICTIKDDRFNRLVETIKPKRFTSAHIEIVDIAGLVEGASKGDGLGNQFLANIRDVNLVFHLLRGFKDESISHPYASVDPARDFGVIRSEFLLSDLELINRRIKKLGKKGGEEYTFLLDVADSLKRGETPSIDPMFSGYGLISIKPEIIVLNIDELKTAPPLDAYPISVKLEQEMIDLPEEDRRTFRKEYGLDLGGPRGLIDLAIQKLGMIFFYTIKGEESRAWIAKSGTKAIEAAAMIHGDLEEGFIKAEVATAENIITLGGYQHVHETGKVKIEGKDYEVKDGDVLLIRYHS